jgi:glycosidase
LASTSQQTAHQYVISHIRTKNQYDPNERENNAEELSVMTSLLTNASREGPYLPMNADRRSRSSGNSENLAAAYIRDCTASLHSSGHSLNQKRNVEEDV